MADLSLPTAALAGLVSFLSPCVLPLIPGYISFISGISLRDLQDTAPSHRQTIQAFISSIWFVTGFSLVFIALGASATVLGQLFLAQQFLFKRIAGVIVILFGLHLTGLIRIPFLQYEKKFDVRRAPVTGLGALVIGAAFAFGWTPCIGPILAGILTLAGTQKTVTQGMLLLTAYSLGLGLPFLLTSLGVGIFFRWMNQFRKYLRTVEIFSGILLIAVGLLIFTDRLTLLSRYFSFFGQFSL